MDGLHKCFWLTDFPNVFVEKGFQNPCFERKNGFSLVLKKRKREKNEPNKKENLKNISMDGLHKCFWFIEERNPDNSMPHSFLDIDTYSFVVNATEKRGPSAPSFIKPLRIQGLIWS